MIHLQINSNEVELSKEIVSHSFAMCLAFCAFLFSVALGVWVVIVAPYNFKIAGALMIWGGCIAYGLGVWEWRFLMFIVGNGDAR